MTPPRWVRYSCERRLPPAGEATAGSAGCLLTVSAAIPVCHSDDGRIPSRLTAVHIAPLYSHLRVRQPVRNVRTRTLTAPEGQRSVTGATGPGFRLTHVPLRRGEGRGCVV